MSYRVIKETKRWILEVVRDTAHQALAIGGARSLGFFYVTVGPVSVQISRKEA